jgi:hypothetical protein
MGLFLRLLKSGVWFEKAGEEEKKVLGLEILILAPLRCAKDRPDTGCAHSFNLLFSRSFDCWAVRMMVSQPF